MVRVGEFSPLNPNLNSGRPLLGLGEYEERRKALLEQRKREYFQSMEQVLKVRISSLKCDNRTINVVYSIVEP